MSPRVSRRTERPLRVASSRSRSAGPAIAVHGGAGRERAAERAARRAGVARAADAGWAVLAAGGRPRDAVVAAVVVLEDDPHFNAGLGSVLTEDGTVELDASVMEGTCLRAGAVGAVAGVANPVRLARALLEEGREVLLVGPAAAERARQHGLALVTPEALVTAAARQRWRRAGDAPGETVGAVARDGRGRVAAATSTGGPAGQPLGRDRCRHLRRRSRRRRLRHRTRGGDHPPWARAGRPRASDVRHEPASRRPRGAAAPLQAAGRDGGYHPGEPRGADRRRAHHGLDARGGPDPPDDLPAPP